MRSTRDAPGQGDFNVCRGDELHAHYTRVRDAELSFAILTKPPRRAICTVRVAHYADASTPVCTCTSVYMYISYSSLRMKKRKVYDFALTLTFNESGIRDV